MPEQRNNQEAPVAAIHFDSTKPFAFVSYCHADKEQVIEDTAQLSKDGYNLFLDPHLDKTEDSWREQVRHYLESDQCKLVVFFCSKHAVLSENCLCEIDKCRQMEKKWLVVEVCPVTVLESLFADAVKLLADPGEEGLEKKARTLYRFVRLLPEDKIRVLPPAPGRSDREYFNEIETVLEKSGIYWEEPLPEQSYTHLETLVSQNRKLIFNAAMLSRESFLTFLNDPNNQRSFAREEKIEEQYDRHLFLPDFEYALLRGEKQRLADDLIRQGRLSVLSVQDADEYDALLPHLLEHWMGEYQICIGFEEGDLLPKSRKSSVTKGFYENADGRYVRWQSFRIARNGKLYMRHDRLNDE